MLHKTYWKIRKVVLIVIFFFKKNFYKASMYIGLEKTAFHAKKNVLIEVPKKIALNLLLFLAALCLDANMVKIFKSVSVDQTLISDILIAMVGIAGVFLGLYCCYIATVFSTKYVNVPQEISSLFRNDFINSKSINAITNYIIYSIIMLISNMFFNNIRVVNIAINMIMGIYMIVSYVYIGKHILSMSNTYFVAESIYRFFFREFKKISEDTLFIKDENFQYHIKKSACKNIETLKIINMYNLEGSDVKSTSLFNFMRNNLTLLYSYMKIKNYIPHDSLWFRTVEYKKWYSAGDMEIRVALETGSFLSNGEKTDNFWFEKEILKINELGLKALIDKNEFDLIRKYIVLLESLLSESIKAFDTQHWINYIQNVQKKISQIIINNDCKTEDELALSESISMIYLQFAIDIQNFLKEFDVTQILNYSVKETKFEKSKYYKLFNNDVVASIYKGIIAEQKIEKKKITPDWYIKQLIAKQIYDEFEQLCNAIEIVNDNMFNLAEEYADSKKSSSATLVYAEYIEWYHKIFISLNYIENVLKETKKYHKEIPNFVWTEYDFKRLIEKLNNTYNNVLAKWSKCAMEFAISNWDNYDDFPDMLGSCYNNVCHFLIQALANDDYEIFEKTYPSLWGIVILYQELSRKELVKIKEPYKQHSVLAIICNPILDFGSISGYAYLWGEISGNDKWKNLIIDSFANIIEVYKEKKDDICTQISTCLSIPNSLGPAIYNRSIIHTDWGIILEKAFETSGCIEWERKGFCEVVKSDCKWLKKLIGTRSNFGLSLPDGYEIFGALVLNNYLDDDKKYTTRSGWEKDV